MKFLLKHLLLVVVIFIVISALFALFFQPLDNEKTLSLTQLVEEIQQEKIEKIIVSDNDLEITYHGGEKAFAKKEPEIALSESLINYGVDKEKLQTVQIIPEEKQEILGWLGPILYFLPFLFLIFFFWLIFRQAKTGTTQVFNFTKAKARLFGAEGHSKEKITFKDVAGLKEVKEELKEIVDFLKNPKKYLRMGARIPRGVLLMGPPGTGKCITGESFIITNKGPIKIREIPKYFRVNEKGKVLGCEVFTIDLQNLEFKKEIPSYWFDLGKQKTIRIIPQIGMELEGTPEHPIVVLNKKTGNLEFKKLEDIKRGDLLVLNYNHQVFGNYKILPDGKTAYLLGLLIGDGGLSIKNRICFTNENERIIRFVKNYFKNYFNVELHKAKSRKYDWYISDWKVKERFREYGISESHARGKEVPESIILGPKEYQTAFLKGLFDTDGSCSAQYSVIELSSASERLVRQAQILLLNLGIISRLRKRKANKFGPYYHYLEITGDFVEKFAQEIGFGIQKKQKRLNKILGKTRNTNVNLIFHQQKRLLSLWNYFRLKSGKLNRSFYNISLIKNLYRYLKGERSPSKYTLDSLLEFFSKRVPPIKNLPEYKYLQELGDNRFFFTPVREIEKGRKKTVYDFTVPGSHSFIANGLINHNTLLSRAVAGEANVPFFHISGSEFVEMFVGVGSARVRDLFNSAKKKAPAIIFIDELDAIGRHRGAGIGGGHDEREQTLNQILVEMDGFERDTKLIVMSATNRADILDPALLRPGRFDRRVVLDLPDINDREEVLKIHSRGKPLAANTVLKEIAERTPGFSGADLANLVNEAAILAARRDKDQIYQEEMLESIEKVLLGPERKSHLLSEKEKEIAAYHEAGHALVSTFLPATETVRKISIVARGLAAGYTLKMPTKERKIKTKSQFLADISALLGGYVAEKIKFGEITTGAANDLKKASKLARKLVKEYGMSSLGPISFGETEELVFLGKEITEQRNYSEKVAAQIDNEVSRFIQEARKQAKKILTKKKRLLDKVARTLIEKETIEKKEFEELIEKRKPPKKSKKRPKRSSLKVKIKRV
jgi:ATP-dependent metalloprotease FtsH